MHAPTTINRKNLMNQGPLRLLYIVSQLIHGTAQWLCIFRKGYMVVTHHCCITK